MAAPSPPKTATAGPEVATFAIPTDSTMAAKAKNRPDDSNFTQQTLPMWTPILTLRWSVGVLVVGTIACFALGGLVLHRSINSSVYRVVYDSLAAVESNQSDGRVAYADKCHLATPREANSFSGTKTCFVTINLQRDIVGDTLVFYELSPFYQNHRRYMTSQLPQQYMGGWQVGDTTSACDPILTSPSSVLCNGTLCYGTNKSRQHYPCGLVANTMFNDIFWLHNGSLPSGQQLGPTDLVHTGIARTFQSYNFANPSRALDLDSFLPIWHNPNYSRIIPPPGTSMPPHITSDYTNSTAWTTVSPGTGVENEFFRVWVHLAAGNVLRKPYGRVAVRNLPAGTTLTFAVQSNYYTDGAKAIVVGEVTWFGSENVPLGIVFLVAGSVCFVATVVLAYKAIWNPRRLGDVTMLKWKLQ
ncbi:hypothetical protein H310_02267 [Aphanomyces invadans]|uniref:ALA-interacting subunit n=1 Tax=Aphanomyces invadans TaxID=157072 RepID=A0A024UNT9_9STRA|nr:hypothetical protein H310_02267 [Aphanomyces invadans]ETW07845.1 hypothetical protein H310_02267 [Aphanomyces invadans]|eukprot:XP_008863938.1 hypothetical protein H310_02267 [Aphanomyces invadans]